MLEKLQSKSSTWITNRSGIKGKTSGECPSLEWEELLDSVNNQIKASQERVKEQEIKEQEKQSQQANRSFLSKAALDMLTGGGKSAPYSRLADENGIIQYNNVNYVCDYDTNSICLGNMSNPDMVLTIPLPTGGYLRVNRYALEDLSASIKLFSPQDITAIMCKLAQENMLENMQQQLEEEASGIKIVDKKEEEAKKE